MSIEGNATGGQVIKGKIRRLDTLTISAYGIAVKNGFEGTEEEWLESLKPSDKQIAEVLAAYMAEHPTSSSRLGQVTLLGANWEETDDPHRFIQVVEVEGATANSQVDLTPTGEQLAAFYGKDVAFTTSNKGGVVTVTAVGKKPLNDYTIQVTITEVYA